MVYLKGKNKIVFLTEDIFGESIGGVEQHIYHVAKELAHLGNEITIISLKIGKKSSNVQQKIIQSNGQVTLIKVVRKNWLIWPLQFLERHIHGLGGMFVAFIGKLIPNMHCRAVLAEVRKVSPHIVHQHDYLANIVASKLLARQMPVFFTNHTGQYLFLEKYRISRFIQRFLISHFTAIIGPSEELTPNDPRSTYISNGVDVSFFKREDIEKVSSRIVFICPRRWAPTKGVLFLAQSLALLGKPYSSKVRVLFAGSDSDDFPWYRDQVAQALSKVPDEMYELLGNLSQEELRSSYSRSNVVVIPSLMEATSLAAMEGMSCGLPVLSTNVGGMPDVVEHGVTGWLVPPEDASALAVVIREIVNRDYDCDAMGASAALFVRDNKSWTIIAAQVSQVYRHGIRLMEEDLDG